MATLYELDKQIEQVIETGFVFDEETGEILMDSSALDELQIAFEDKLKSCGCWMKNKRALADAIKAEESALKKRREKIENELERMGQYVLNHLDRIPDHRFESPECVISTRKSKRVVIEDESLIPDEYTTVKTTITPIKAKIGKAITNGMPVPGAAVYEYENLQVK